jgi:hypothetical protein
LATLKDVDFKTGTIEADFWLSDNRSYPGIIFRKTNNNQFEYVYIRPHRIGLYDDAVQYAPAFNNEVCWQLYFGETYNSKLKVDYNKWVHIKLEVYHDNAKLYVENMETPILNIKQLETENTHGNIQVLSGRKETYISNIKITNTIKKDMRSEINKTVKSDYLKDWEISKLFSKKEFYLDRYPRFYKIYDANWEPVKAENSGLLNITKYRKHSKEKNTIYAKTTIASNKNKRLKLAFGYSDAVKIYLNKQLIYSGNYAYRSRGNSFGGAIALKDTLYLDLKKGLNELFIKSNETFGGWGLKFKAKEKIETVKKAKVSISKDWNFKLSDFCPESVLYDEKTDAIYVSHFDNQFRKRKVPVGFISKLSVEGKMLDSLWVSGLKSPTGMCRYKDKMYIVDRKELVEISIKKQKIIATYKYPKHIVFANDVVCDSRGNIYITNSDASEGVTDILTLKNGKVVSWIASDQFQSLNGMWIDGDELLLGNSVDATLKAIDIKTKKIRTIASLGSGTVDGIRLDRQGDVLVSKWEGVLYHITKQGKVTEILNAIGKFNIADFEYNLNSQTIFVPTFLDNGIRVFKLK